MKPDADFVELAHRSARLTLDPRRGGAIRAFSWRGEDILRPTPADAGDDPFDVACFPMVPFVNRVALGRFSFGARSVQLQRNWSEDPHPLHGQGWRRPWRMLAASGASATLQFAGGADDWPWQYAAQQRFQLQDGGLSVELSVENLSDTPMPAMLGLHPYFPDAAHAQLQAQLPRVWLTDTAVLAKHEISTPPSWLFDPARSVGSVPLDNSFCGWNGTARLFWPGRIVTLRASHCGCLHVYSPAGQEFFCVEPQTAPPGALERNAGEAAVIQPGESLAIAIQFEIGAS
jgi:aldose 1-epimerase